MRKTAKLKTIEEMVAEAERRGVSYGKLMEQLYAEECACRPTQTKKPYRRSPDKAKTIDGDPLLPGGKKLG